MMMMRARGGCDGRKGGTKQLGSGRSDDDSRRDDRRADEQPGRGVDGQRPAPDDEKLPGSSILSLASAGLGAAPGLFAQVEPRPQRMTPESDRERAPGKLGHCQ